MLQCRMRMIISMVLLLLCSSALASEIMKVSVSGVDRIFHLEAAFSEEEKLNGLMHRTKLDSSDGMIFIYNEPETVKMWMKNTLIPLDMIFADRKGRIVYIREKTVPLSLEKIGPDIPVSYIIELNAGEVEKHRIRIADTITISR